MKKALLLTIVVMLVAATSAFAAPVYTGTKVDGFFVFDEGTFVPLVAGVPQVLCLGVSKVPVLDAYGNATFDPITKDQIFEYDWLNSPFMFRPITGGLIVGGPFVQSVTLKKHHELRKRVRNVQ
jgi:hypothetical protein